MLQLVISYDQFPGFVERLMGRYRVYGPVPQGQAHTFSELRAVGELDLSYRNTRLSPKDLFHPQSNCMFRCSLADSDPQARIFKETGLEVSPRVILGIRPCDARAFQLDDANFDTPDIKDPWWVRRREATTLVGLACSKPCSTCFCTSVGTGPFDPAGLDVLLVAVGSGYVATAQTDKGTLLLSMVEGGAPVLSEAVDEAARLKGEAESRLGTAFDVGSLVGKDMTELFNASFWDEVQFACINCGTCTFVCPTCWCFDIQDEVQGDRGVRLRNWDSCMFPLFTHHGSGHNPRSQKLQRVRQRFMHKLKYYPDKYHNGVACVGCGRCVGSCPVNIDIQNVARLMTAGCVCPA